MVYSFVQNQAILCTKPKHARISQLSFSFPAFPAFYLDRGHTGGNELSAVALIWLSVKYSYVMKMAGKLLMKLMGFIPEDKPISVHQLTCRSGLDHRTIKRYLDLIIEIQAARKVVKEQVGLRVLVKKEK